MTWVSHSNTDGLDSNSGGSTFSKGDARGISVLVLSSSYPMHEESVSGLFVQRLAEALALRCQNRVLAPSDVRNCSTVSSYPEIKSFRYAPLGLQRLAHGAGGIPAALKAKRANFLLVPPFLLSMLIACFKESKGASIIFANWSICGIVAGLVGLVRGIPVVVTIRGEDGNRAGSGRLFKYLLRLWARLCSRIVTVSNAMADSLKANMPALDGKLLVIPNGVAQAFLDLPPCNASDRIRLLCISSLIPRKSVDTLIKALAQLPSKYTLRIVGEGPEALSLKRLSASLGLMDRIEFTSFQPYSQIPGLFSHAVVFILPSLAEGRPNVVIEALAAARPVVASDIDGIRELIGSGDGKRGLLFPPADADALADQLRSLDDPLERNRLAEQGRRFIIDEGLTWEQAANRYLRLFEDLITRNSTT